MLVHSIYICCSPTDLLQDPGFKIFFENDLRFPFFVMMFRAGMMWVFMAQTKFQLPILMIWQIVELFWTITMFCQFVHPLAVLLWLADIQYILVSQALAIP